MIASAALIPTLPLAWPAPQGVCSVITCAQEVPSAQAGIVSETLLATTHAQTVYGPFNLALHVGDSRAKVNACRQALAHQIGVPAWQWLNQVHGVEVVESSALAQVPDADACFTTQKNLVCAVLTADCLPVLLCNAQGTQVAAVHAGWRGLATGILEATCRQFARSDRLIVYLGPAIGPSAFEVGAEVKAIFEQAIGAEASLCFKESQQKKGHFFADLYALARLKLERLGIKAIYGGTDCTFNDHRFYSYRRQGVIGRFASAIWLTG